MPVLIPMLLIYPALTGSPVEPLPASSGGISTAVLQEPFNELAKRSQSSNPRWDPGISTVRGTSDSQALSPHGKHPGTEPWINADKCAGFFTRADRIKTAD